MDFSGLALGDGIYPTDIDGLIEYHNSLYIIFEIKYLNPYVPGGQRVALERAADDFAKAGKSAVVFVATHDIQDPYADIDASMCVVQKYYRGGSGRWTSLNNTNLRLGTAIRAYRTNPARFS